MATVSVNVCDVCNTPPAVRYSIERQGKRAAVDLCSTHAQPLEQFILDFPVAAKKRRNSDYDGRRATMEEVEKARQEYLDQQEREKAPHQD